MKILSDFDGVVTNQLEEAGRVTDLFKESWTRLRKEKPESIEMWMNRAAETMKKEPWNHGWWMKGRISAFCNEDLFIWNNGMGACLDGWAREGEKELQETWKRLEEAGIGGFSGLMQKSYTDMVGETHAGKMKPMDPEAVDAFRRMLSEGHEIVVVSNSGTARILELLKNEGLEAVAHDVDPKARLRVRGDARKFELGEEAKAFPIGAYQVDWNRPVYERILLEEDPDMVIGDVFSLDLALPIRLFEERKGRPLFPYFRKRSYSPDWVLSWNGPIRAFDSWDEVKTLAQI